ncbi:MAG TPA: PAS domain-containing protein, partial [Usitatibacter sp.]
MLHEGEDLRSPAPGRSHRRIVWHLSVLALATLLPFLALTAGLAGMIVVDELEDAAQDAYLAAESTSTELERHVGQLDTILSVLARREKVVALDPSRCDPLLTDLLRIHPEFANVSTLDAAGRRICSALELTPGSPTHTDPRNYLDELKARKAFVVGKPTKGIFTGKWVVSAARPILGSDGEMLGAVSLALDLVHLASIADRQWRGPGTVAVLNSDGIMIARHPDGAAWVGRDVSAASIVRIIRERRSGSARATGLAGIERIWGFAPVRGTDWTVLTGIPSEVVVAPALRTAYWLAGFAVLVAAVVAALCVALAHPIADSVQSIAMAARRMSSGDSNERIEPVGPVEIAALADDLNQMIDHRQAAERELRDRAREIALVMDNYPGMVAHMDRDLHYVYASAGYGTILGHDPKSVIGKHPRDIVGEEQFAKAEPFFRRALAGERATFEAEVPLPSGKSVPFMVSLLPNLEADGAVKGVFLFAIDITERRAAEARLRDERARLAGILMTAM